MVSAQYKKGTQWGSELVVQNPGMWNISVPERLGDSSLALGHFHFKELVTREVEKRVSKPLKFY